MWNKGLEGSNTAQAASGVGTAGIRPVKNSTPLTATRARCVGACIRGILNTAGQLSQLISHVHSERGRKSDGGKGGWASIAAMQYGTVTIVNVNHSSLSLF